MAITAKTYPKILKYGLQAAYNALDTKDPNVLYFCTDTKKIYKGAVDFTDSVVFATSSVDVTSPIVGKLYVFSTTGTCEVYTGTEWKVVSYPIVTTIDASSDNTHVPSAKAVYDFVENEISGLASGDKVVKSIAVKTDDEGKTVEGTITYKTGDDVAHDVALTGVVTTPTYEAATRKFTFPVVGGAALEVELGKDIFINPDANNRYENGNIYLYLNDGSQKESGQNTELVIPVTGLVTDYFGDDTNTVQVNVDSSTHKVTADVIVRADSTVEGEEFTNALKVSTVDGKKGLYVDLSGVEAEIKALSNRLDTAEATLEKLEGDNSVSGSIAQQIKAESDTLKNGVIKTAQDTANANTAAIGILNGDASTEGSVAKAVADESKVLKEGVIKTAQDTADSALAKAEQNEADIAALANSLLWEEF